MPRFIFIVRPVYALFEKRLLEIMSTGAAKIVRLDGSCKFKYTISNEMLSKRGWRNKSYKKRYGKVKITSIHS